MKLSTAKGVKSGVSPPPIPFERISHKKDKDKVKDKRDQLTLKL